MTAVVVVVVIHMALIVWHIWCMIFFSPQFWLHLIFIVVERLKAFFLSLLCYSECSVLMICNLISTFFCCRPAVLNCSVNIIYVSDPTCCCKYVTFSTRRNWYGCVVCVIRCGRTLMWCTVGLIDRLLFNSSVLLMSDLHLLQCCLYRNKLCQWCSVECLTMINCNS